ncbi:MAG: hypothetical protein KJO84_06000 [Acidimicrobiia bacterium]|nr:hypothetical protein [Acidimicrobiia bacterium]
MTEDPTTPDPRLEDLDELGERRVMSIAGVRLAGRRRRPSGERAPLPRQWDRVGIIWLVVAGAVIALWALLFTLPATVEWWTLRDVDLAQAVARNRSDGVTDVTQALNALGSEWTIRTLRVGLVLALVLFKEWRRLFVALGSILILEIVVNTIKVNTARPRPYVIALAPWEGWSHPSRPVAALAATLAIIGIALIPIGVWRKRFMIAAALAVVLLGVSNVYLGVDHATDVIVAGFFGAALPLLAYRFLVPEGVFPLTYGRGTKAHVDIGGARGDAMRLAVGERLDVEVLSIEKFGTEASGGSTPLLITCQDVDGERQLFAKLYTQIHLRSDRWYKYGRTLLYGSLEDEVRWLSVKRLAEHEDYMMRIMRDAGIPVPESHGYVTITPEREYLIITEFLAGAKEIGKEPVTEEVIDAALEAVRAMWDGAVAHRDIKPGNVMVSNGRVSLIDTAFGIAQPSAWREAVDLANMLLILGLYADPEHVYRRALLRFAHHDVAEAFAATRAITIPTQLKRLLKAHEAKTGVDLVEYFDDITPDCEPISVQRWSTKRVALWGATILGAMTALSLVIDNVMGQGFL